MSYSATIQSLPIEVLEMILNHLDWHDLQSAMLVCRCWAVTLFEARSRTIRLNIAPNTGDNVPDYQFDKLQEYHQTLLRSDRSYKHIAFYWDGWDTSYKTVQTIGQMLLDAINQFQQSLVSLKITAKRFYMPAEIMSEMLRSCSNLELLDLNAMQGSSFDFGRKKTFRTRIRTLYDSRQVISCYPRAPNMFDNVSTLQVKITSRNKLKDLFRKLSRQLIHLTLGWEFDRDLEWHARRVAWPKQHFPILETLILTSEIEAEPDEQLGQFLQRMPKLRALTLPPHHHQDNGSVLQWVNQENLRHLDVTTFALSRRKFPFITRFAAKLETLCIRGYHAMPDDGPLEDGIEFRNVRRLALQGHGWRFFLNEFIVFFPNLVELELHERKCYKYAIDNPPSIKRLTVYEGLGSLKAPMDFCEEHKIPELVLVAQSNAFNIKDNSEDLIAASHIRMLSIHASQIESCMYEPMMESMPNLKRLELTLQVPCDNETYQRIRSKFPQCEIVRNCYRKFESIFDMYNRYI